MGDAASLQHGRKRCFCHQMGVLRMLSAETAAPDAAEKDAPFCRLTLAWIVFHSWGLFNHWSDSAALSFRPRSDKQLGVSGT